MKGRELALYLIEEGLLSPTLVVEACINYLTDDEVQEMLEQNEFIPLEEGNM